MQPPTQSNFQIKIHNFNVIQDTKQGKECKIVSTSPVENNDAFLKQKKPLSKLSFSGKHCFNSFLFDSKRSNFLPLDLQVSIIILFERLFMFKPIKLLVTEL